MAYNKTFVKDCLLFAVLVSSFNKKTYICILLNSLLLLYMINSIDFSKFRCALFDLDGVVFDTEPQYTEYWATECRRYRPDIPFLEHKIKGMALTAIYETYFSEVEDEWSEMRKRLYSWECGMAYRYVAGCKEFVKQLHDKGIKTAIVTSSNRQKMEYVYPQHPNLKDLFDEILTAEDFEYSKPHPDCYLRAMARFGCSPQQSMVFEDSINGLKAGKASGAFVVGLSTTNPAEAIRPYADIIIGNYLDN